MRHERLGFQRNADRPERSVDCGRQPRQIIGRFDFGPQQPWAARVWEKSQASKFQRYLFAETYFRERVTNRGGPLRRDFTNEFQSDMEVSRRNPTGRWISILEFTKQRRQPLTN